MADGIVTLQQAKALRTVGTRFRVEFTSPSAGTREFFGTIVDEISVHGKLMADLECSVCGALHRREQSDWHSCWKCRTCKGPGRKSAGAVANASMNLLAQDPELAELQRRVVAAKVADLKAKLLAELAALEG